MLGGNVGRAAFVGGRKGVEGGYLLDVLKTFDIKIDQWTIADQDADE